MNLSLARRTVQLAAANDIEASVSEGYSGRGMYGRSTAAVQTSDTSALRLAAIVGMVADQDDDDDMESVGSLQSDQMGLGVIVY